MGDQQALLPDLSAASSVKAQNCSRGAGLDLSFSVPRELPCQHWVKFMCSHGGKVVPRPSDRKLRYVGGETRIFSVPRHIRYAGFLSKMTEIYGQDLSLKYQLPEEDLNALVSVCSDDDLENMMEECDRLDSCKGLSKLRVFIFSPSELDTTNLSDMADTSILDQIYVDSVNELLPEASFRRQNDSHPAESWINSEGDDAFAWNATIMQEKSTVLSENPQSEAFLPTGNGFLYKPPPPEHVAAATSPLHAPSHSTFARKPAVFETAPEGATLGVDTFLDLECCRSGSSPSSSYNELHRRPTDSRRIPNSPMQALKELTLDQDEEDRGYRVEKRCMAEVRGHQGVSHSMMQATVSREKLEREEPPDLQNDRCELGSADDNERSDNQQHTDLPWPTTNLQQRQLQADWDQVDISFGEKLIVIDPLQKPPRNVSFRQQQAFPVEPQQPPQNLPFCNRLATLDQKSVVPGQMEQYSPEDSSCAQKLFPAEAQFVPQHTSTSVYHTGGSAPSSPTREKVKATGKPGAVPLEGQIHQTLMKGFMDQEFPSLLYDYDGSCKNKASCCTSGHPLWSFLTPETTFNENSKDPHHLGRKLVDVEDVQFDGLPILALSSAIHKQQIGLSTFQNNEDAKDAEAFPKRLQPPCLPFSEASLPTANSGATNTYTAVLSENEQFHTPGHIPLHLGGGLPPPAAVEGDIPILGRAMVSESLHSFGLSHCLPADMLVADMSASMSLDSPLEPCLGGVDFTAREKTQPKVGKIGAIEPLTSVQRNSEENSFASAQDSVSSREQLNKIRCHFDEGMDLDDTKGLENFGETMRTPFDPAQCLAPFLAAAWETSFSQSEHENCAFMENLSKEKDLEALGSCLAMENEVTHEDLNLEIEELDRFESLADQTSNAAVLAEKEAMSRGLQTINNFDLEELHELGSGTFGTVYHGKWRGTDVAIKRIKSSCFTGRKSERERLIADFWREAYILGQLHHPNVVAFYGVVPDGPGGTLATVTEFMVNGSLKQVLQKKDRTLDPRKRLLIAMDAAFGMEYLHGKNVVHFDIKCENLLVNLRDTQRPICKVGDLGLSKVKQQTMVSGGVRGTLPWMAPELLNGNSSLVSEKVDVFSFGIVLWELLTGEEPYANMHYGAIIGGIVNNTLRPMIPTWCDPAWRSLMKNCWSADPAERPTFTEIAGSLRMMEASLYAKTRTRADCWKL